MSKDHFSSSSSEASSDKPQSSISYKSKLFANDTSEKENTLTKDSLHSLPGKLPVQFKNIFNVGFSKMPKQIYRKTIKRGFTFNIMLVGVAGLGKSTFLNSLFMTDIYNDEFPVRFFALNVGYFYEYIKLLIVSLNLDIEFSIFDFQSAITCTPLPFHRQAPSARFYNDASIAASVASHTFSLMEQNVSLRLTVIDAPGYGEALDNSSCWRLLVEEINRRNANFMEAESRVQRDTTGNGCGGSGGRLGVLPEDLVHACFYFLSPTGHGVRQMDLEAMRALHDKTLKVKMTASSKEEAHAV
ncbi:unnamed protein product [Hydatigera taeniaeformis]|uniref:Septin-type G domain-containing protein n=1 Tax=Hydatigena taeniaeformis TaxID=6205 RepID=A0A3P7FNG5_HYDTA|nr:unnamed protein product [Hydatigera taeniaeformis]